MDTRADFQRLLEDMDKVIEAKRQELGELDERLESARSQLSEKEARELRDLTTNYDDDDENPTKDVSDESRANLGSTKLRAEAEQRSIAYERQLEQFGEELSELESINRQLNGENERLSRDMESRREESEQLKAKVRVLIANLEEVQGANLELNLRLARAERELMTQRKLLKKSYDQDEVLMGAFQDKMQALEKELAWRDEEIKRLRSSNQFALETLGIKMVDGNDDKSLLDSSQRQRVIEIAEAFREKETQIELLKSQLVQATKDLERNANLLEVLSKESTGSAPTNQQQKPAAMLDIEIELGHRCAMLESELEAKDKQLHLAEFRIRHFETILPNMINELMRELINYCLSHRDAKKEEGSIKDAVEHLVNQLDSLLGELSSARSLLDQVDLLKAQNVAQERQIEQLVNELNQSDARLSLRQEHGDSLQTKLEDEGLSPMRVFTAANDNNQMDSSKDKCQVSSTAESPKDDMKHKEGPPEATKRPLRLAKEERTIRATTSTTTDEHMESALGLQSRLRQLEGENELMEFAMKEILMSIKWSDAQCSTILIDCPSLERLCQLIEARFIASNSSVPSKRDLDQAENLLFQMIVLKSELDLLRGQNEQLRANAKSQRRNQLLLAYRGELLDEGREITLETEVGERCETGCQTMNNDELLEEEKKISRCDNCSKLASLTGHLLQCIMRLETRVNVSDETYISRLISLHQLIQMLERDLSIRDQLVKESRRESHSLRQDKQLAESRFQLAENQLQVHLSTCPLARLPDTARNLQVYTATQNDHGDSIQSFTTFSESLIGGQQPQQANERADGISGSNRAPTTRARMTISLLQSIIGCLQARLDYKDERLKQLEALVAGRVEFESQGLVRV